MDDMLASSPAAFRALRVMWKRSFVKLDDSEERAFRDLFLRRNLVESPSDRFRSDWRRYHRDACLRLGAEHELHEREMIVTCAAGEDLKHEMAIEVALLGQLTRCEAATTEIFGEWDFLHHQVAGSPFKPVDYMDRMDVFGFKYVPSHKPTVASYLVGEIKKGQAEPQDVSQTMKYVDWVAREYAHGDYGTLAAFLVARAIPEAVIAEAKSSAARGYTVGHRPTLSRTWRKLSLVRYSYKSDLGRVEFEKVWG